CAKDKTWKIGCGTWRSSCMERLWTRTARMTDTLTEGFVCFAEWLALSPCQAQRFYAALHGSSDRHARSVLFALERFASRRSQSGMLRDLARFGLGPGSPRNLIGLLERLIEQGLL